MAEKPKNPAGFLERFLRGWRDAWREWASAAFEPFILFMQNRHKLKTAAANHIAIGRSQLAQGMWNDAVFRFRFALWLDKNNAEAAGMLARAYLAKGAPSKARQAAQRAQALDAANADAAEVLAALQQA